jgi:hypothetical protein
VRVCHAVMLCYVAMLCQVGMTVVPRSSAFILLKTVSSASSQNENELVSLVCLSVCLYIYIYDIYMLPFMPI